MIQVFCSGRGSGKTKKLIDLANKNHDIAKGNLVYIDDDTRPMLQLKRNIRFVSTKEYDVRTPESFYGLLCGVLSSDYDIEYIFIDGLSNIVNSSINDLRWIFEKIESISEKMKINIFINENFEENSEIPYFIKEYVA